MIDCLAAAGFPGEAREINVLSNAAPGDFVLIRGEVVEDAYGDRIVKFGRFDPKHELHYYAPSIVAIEKTEKPIVLGDYVTLAGKVPHGLPPTEFNVVAIIEDEAWLKPIGHAETVSCIAKLEELRRVR